jgi:indolepyruvate ferredoxin oxidoreductase
MTARLPIEGTPALADYKLTDNLTATRGRIFLTGTQALVRLVLMQRALDKARGMNTAGFISGYRGSPLGMVDQQLWKANKLLAASDIRFLPAINEELGGTAVLGTQRVESDPERTVEGVFAMWYGKGPGVDRAGDHAATRSSMATPTARRRMVACWWSRATITAVCRRRCRIKATLQ